MVGSQTTHYFELSLEYVTVLQHDIREFRKVGEDSGEGSICGSPQLGAK
jgi:hypothetical protein